MSLPRSNDSSRRDQATTIAGLRLPFDKRFTTDEVGGRAYNLALGQKRAEAVRRSLSVLGVSDAQMEAVSFGEERPAVSGGGENERNRRVEFKYR